MTACARCNAPLPQGVATCGRCGAPVAPAAAPQDMTANPADQWNIQVETFSSLQAGRQAPAAAPQAPLPKRRRGAKAAVALCIVLGIVGAYAVLVHPSLVSLSATVQLGTGEEVTFQFESKAAVRVKEVRLRVVEKVPLDLALWNASDYQSGGDPTGSIAHVTGGTFLNHTTQLPDGDYIVAMRNTAANLRPTVGIEVRRAMF